MTAFTSTTDLEDAVQEVLERLREGKIDAKVAHTEIRGLNVIQKSWDTRLEHARLTGRLAQGDEELPALKIARAKRG